MKVSLNYYFFLNYSLKIIIISSYRCTSCVYSIMTFTYWTQHFCATHPASKLWALSTRGGGHLSCTKTMQCITNYWHKWKRNTGLEKVADNGYGNEQDSSHLLWLIFTSNFPSIGLGENKKVLEKVYGTRVVTFQNGVETMMYNVHRCCFVLIILIKEIVPFVKCFQNVDLAVSRNEELATIKR